jgi:uncharacterized membrane protein YecN with MAPEG domain
MFDNLKALGGKLGKMGNFIPLALISVLFMAENEVGKHAFHSSCNFFINGLVLTIFFLIAVKYNNGKKLGFMIALLIWGILIFLKNCYYPNLK